MKEYELNGAAVTDREDLHRTLAQVMNFPDYYGNNLDALMDVLTDIFEETTLVITGCARLAETLDTYYNRLNKVLLEATRENPSLTVIQIEEEASLPEDTAEDSESQDDYLPADED